MTFKFVNWFFEQKKRQGTLGELAKLCIKDENFPVHAKSFDVIMEYFISTEPSQDELNSLNEAWNEFRTLKKVKVSPLNMLKSSIYEI